MYRALLFSALFLLVSPVLAQNMIPNVIQQHQNSNQLRMLQDRYYQQQQIQRMEQQRAKEKKKEKKEEENGLFSQN